MRSEPSSHGALRVGQGSKHSASESLSACGSRLRVSARSRCRSRFRFGILTPANAAHVQDLIGEDRAHAGGSLSENDTEFVSFLWPFLGCLPVLQFVRLCAGAAP